MLLFPVQQRENIIIVTDGFGNFYELSDYNGYNFLATKIIITNCESTLDKEGDVRVQNINYTTDNTSPVYKIAEVYTVDNYNIDCFIGYTFSDNVVVCKSYDDFIKVITGDK